MDAKIVITKKVYHNKLSNKTIIIMLWQEQLADSRLSPYVSMK